MAARHTSRVWTIFNLNYALALSVTWCGEARVGRRTELLSPDSAFCTEPGELHTTPRIFTPGDFHVLHLETSTLRRHFDEHGSYREPRWCDVAPRLPMPIIVAIRSLVRSFQHGHGIMQLQTQVAQVIEALLPMLVQGAPRAAEFDVGHAKAAMIRECLTYDDGPTLDLETLAARTGLNRFQVLRTFKRRYGVPPHTYQTRIRVARALTLLKSGRSPVDVAAQLGFADQSHMTRVFRSVCGVTPGHYARADTTKL